MSVLSAATTRSQASASSSPPATACPCRTATQGVAAAVIRVKHAGHVLQEPDGVRAVAVEGEELAEVPAGAEAGPGPADGDDRGVRVLRRRR